VESVHSAGSNYAVVLSNGGYFGPEQDVDPITILRRKFARPDEAHRFMFLSVHRALPIGKISSDYL